MTYWYVDTENAIASCEILVENVKRYDRVVFAYGDRMRRLPIPLLAQLTQKQVKLEFLYCLVGSPNAMDFQILMALTYNLAMGIGTAHRILTDDKGYILPVKAWADKGYDISVLRPSVYYASNAPLLDKVRELGVSEAFAPTLVKIITESRGSPEPRQTLYQIIHKMFESQDEGTQLYNLVKHLI